MNNMNEMLQMLSKGYFIHQVLTIAVLFLAGFLFLVLLKCTMNFAWYCALAYPVGLSLWGLSGFILLVTGIPFNQLSVGIFLFLVFLFTGLWNRKRTRETVFEIKWLVILTVVVLVLACAAASGLLTVSVSNDSVYYYSVYPQVLAKTGLYRASYDVFLTDVGQITAIINCLPYFFGFDETFGIQHFFNMSFCLVFFLAVYETAVSINPDWKKRKLAVIMAAASTCFLITATPFLITSKWVLANVYFMDFLFLVFYLAWKCGCNRACKNDTLIIMGMLLAMLSMMRMEGGMMACFLILCISSLPYTNKQLCAGLVLPVAFMQVSYYIMLFIRLRVNPLYSFLDIKNALIMLALLIAVCAYLLFFRGRRILFFTEHIKGVILVGLLLGNLGLCIINPNRFFTNLLCFGKNIILQNGWGYFGFVVLIFLLVLPLGKIELSYADLFTLGYILFTIAVCWARGATLRVGIGDSGNRVMMQIVPFVVYSLIRHTLSWIKEKRKL